MSISNESQQTEEIDPSADMAQDDLDEEIRSEEPDFVFDEKKTHYPMFFLTKIPAGVRLFLRSQVPSLYMLIRSDSIPPRWLAPPSFRNCMGPYIFQFTYERYPRYESPSCHKRRSTYAIPQQHRGGGIRVLQKPPPASR